MMSKQQSCQVKTKGVGYKGLVVLLALVSGVCHAAKQNLTFTATILQGSCEITLAPKTLEFGSVQASNLLVGNKVSEIKPVTVTLSECAGVIGSTLTPSLHFTGTTISEEPYLFRDSGDSKGFGVAISRKSDFDMSSTADLAKNDTYFTFGDSKKGDIVKNGEVMKLYTAISCGSAAHCAKTTAGDLKATAQLEFVYR